MTKSFLGALVLTAGSVSASADVIKCVFTEPFVTTTYSMVQQSLTVDAMGERHKVIKNVSFQIKGPGKFDLVAKNGKVLQSLDLNNKGSDGMSDTIFPYEVQSKDPMMTVNGGYGGCSSNYLKSTPGQN